MSRNLIEFKEIRPKVNGLYVFHEKVNELHEICMESKESQEISLNLTESNQKSMDCMFFIEKLMKLKKRNDFCMFSKCFNVFQLI